MTVEGSVRFEYLLHKAPIGQHATFLALSRVQTDPIPQHAPASAFANVEHEL